MTAPLPDSALDQLFRSARSYNGYLDKPVSEAQIHAIWEVMKYGPTSANMMPARLVWCTSPEAKEKLAATASSTNGDKIRNAPVSVIIGMDMAFHEQLPWLFPHTDARSWFVNDVEARKRHAVRNASLQGAYLMLAARAIGLDCGPMSGYDDAGVNAEFFADRPNITANFICSIGYGDKSSIFDRSPRPEFTKFNSVL